MPQSPSESLVHDFLAANPNLDADLGPLTIIPSGVSNQQWAREIEETASSVLAERGEEGESGDGGRRSGLGEDSGSTEEGVGDGDMVKRVAGMIDHTLLTMDASAGGIDALCGEAVGEGFKSVCVRLPWVQRCAANLKDTPVLTACVAGFPEGTQATLLKLREARAAIAAGAQELDVVLNRALLTSEPPDYASIFAELSSLRALAYPSSSSSSPSTRPTLKLILET